MEIAVGADDLLDARRAERADQLVLQVGDANEEPELLHVRAREVGTKAGTLERAAKHRLLAGVAEAGDPWAVHSGAELLQEGSDAVRSSERNDPYSSPLEVHPAPLGQRFDRDLIAHPFDDNDRA